MMPLWKRLRPSSCRAPARRAFALFALTLALGSGAPADAEPVDRVIVMPTPDAVTSEAAAARFVGKLQTLIGMDVTLIGTTRTGALVIGLPDVLESSTLVGRLRGDRAVLWVDAVPRDGVQKVRAKASSALTGQKLMVRLKDDTTPDWTALSARFSELLGISVTMQRRVGSVWVLKLAEPQPEAKLIDLAALLQEDALVQYADPVLRRFAQAQTPNDPLYAQQWNLTDTLSGINIAGAWALRSAGAPVTVAVVDTGILPHPDLDSSRVLPGYDFVSDPDRARDGDARDANPRDEGDWLADGDCRGHPAQDSSWHGTFVAGLIAATSNNGIGIAGIDSNARILPVRALGHCGGTDEDVFEAMLWAAGVQVEGAPPNPNPAKVINLSLGGFGACAQSIQEAVDDAMAHGAIVVAAAGNQAYDATAFAPANCSGVITVGAHNRQGELTTYSNFGRRIDISAPAGDGGKSDSAMSLSNDGVTTPGAAAYKQEIGTSFSAPLVAGTVSMMLARNPTLTPGQVTSILQATSRAFVTGSPCRLGYFCGAGMLDTGVALASTIPGTDAAPSGTVAVIEYYDAARDHYFITADPAEIKALDASPVYARTGYFFHAYANAALATAAAKAVCRFYADASQLIDSHFFSADASECAFVQQNGAGVWNLETAAAFYVEVPDAAGNCREGTLPVYRFFDGRRDANQRFSMDLSVARGMVNKAWVPDGPGRNGAAFCSPI